MFDMLDILVQANKLVDIFVVIAFICTKVLLRMGTFDDNMDDQVIRRPFVVFIRTGDVNC